MDRYVLRSGISVNDKSIDYELRQAAIGTQTVNTNCRSVCHGKIYQQIARFVVDSIEELIEGTIYLSVEINWYYKIIFNKQIVEVYVFIKTWELSIIVFMIMFSE